MRRALYPGSFDPLTNGHLDIITRAAAMVDELVVAVVCNPSKSPLFSLEERQEMLRACLQGIPNVRVGSFEGLLVDYMQQLNANIIVRGLRAVSDFEFEFQMALMNRNLAPNVDTIFLTCAPVYTYLSSSAVKEVASYGGKISDLVPEIVERQLVAKLSRR